MHQDSVFSPLLFIIVLVAVVVTPVVYTLQGSKDGRLPAALGLSSLGRLYYREERGVRNEGLLCSRLEIFKIDTL